VLVLSVLVFAGAAYAGNGNGNGNGNEGDAPGNSASAPGQVKKDAPPAAVDTTTTTTAAPITTTTDATPPANATGVKPANDTAHDTHAEAQSDKTKEYGNGQTAGQIAEKNGAAGNTVLHGPGNSQPHKVVPCGGRHEVDVHALKSHLGGSCDSSPPHPQPEPTPPGVTPTPPTTTTRSTTEEHQPSAPADPGSKPAGGDAPGAVASSSSPAGDTGGTLSATQRVGHEATLPFTGQRLWLAVLAGLILLATGIALRKIRTADAPVESVHDHTDRSRHAARGSRASGGGRAGR
jgi:hypothetical protein